MAGGVVAMILAGGEGSRLSILSNNRAKPAVPFASNYRIIDFTISNVMHSGVRYLGILTQYKPYSLMSHIGMGEAWGFTGRRSLAKILPPYVGDKDSDWYAGTADAIFQNLSFINRFDPETVLVLSGDHIYNMQYADLIAFHTQNNSDLTIATQPVSPSDTKRFGIVKFDGRGRIEGFQEKPKSNPISNQGNLGIYAFKRKVLEAWLREDASNPESSHDFGKDIIPKMIRECPCYAYEFTHYWRDVGTLQSYWEANVECLNPRSGLNLHDWEVHTNCENIPEAYLTPTQIADGGATINSIVGKGSTIRGKVVNSILFHGIEIGKDTEVRDSVILDGARIGDGVRLHRVICDKNVQIGEGSCLGQLSCESPANRLHPDHLWTGLTLIGKGARIPANTRIGCNCLVHPGLDHHHFSHTDIPCGSTISVNGHDQE